MRRLLRPALMILLAIGLLLAGCSGGQGKSTQPTAIPSFTPLPEDTGSAVLVYTLASKKEGFKASSSIGIPINIGIDPANTKQQAALQGKNVADFVAQVTGNDQGSECTLDFTMMVDYEVRGFYNPGPACDFDISVLATLRSDTVVKSGNCSIALQNLYPVEGVFIPPPPGPHKIPGSLPVKTIRDDDGTKITIELKNVVVPESSGCYFGG
jgi:hypothetical protein